jgi:hypothetical protein
MTLEERVAEPATLIRDADYTYMAPGVGPDQAPRRRLRVWRTGPAAVTCVLTENLSDPGLSITNAAATIVGALDREYGTDIVTVIEHYPHHGPQGPRYSVVSIAADGWPTWVYMPADLLVAELPGLEDTPA